MNRPTFEQTVNVLVKAYLNDELKHGDCEACAVGNIVHAAGFPRYHTGDNAPMREDSCGSWKAVFVTLAGKQRYNYWSDPLLEAKGLKMIEATGYTIKELARVELAFETADDGHSDDEWMFNGLMAVCDVLADIHGVDLSVKESAKLLFVK